MKADPINVIPKSALVPGVLGLMPVVFLTAVIIHQAPKVHAETLTALLAYGAVILSFLAGVRWGLVISGSSQLPFVFEFGIVVLPPLAGWGSILIEKPAGFLVLSISFSLLLLMDYIISGAPRWYLRLRVILSLPVIACLLIVLSVQ